MKHDDVVGRILASRSPADCPLSMSGNFLIIYLQPFKWSD